VISVMHEPHPPKTAGGADFYDSVLVISGGVATKRPLGPDLPAEITAILSHAAEDAQPSPLVAEGARRTDV
jgi:hypothetical protein